MCCIHGTDRHDRIDEVILQRLDVTCRRGKWMQGDAESSMYEIVSTADWLQLLTRHAAGEEDSIRCESCIQLVKDCQVMA